MDKKDIKVIDITPIVCIERGDNMVDKKYTLKHKLKEIRMKEYMMNQRDFANEILQMDYRKYNRYENGVTPGGEMILYISMRLNRPVKEVFYLVEND